LNPEYNINQKASAPLSGFSHSDETKIIMSESAKKIDNSGRFNKPEGVNQDPQDQEVLLKQ